MVENTVMFLSHNDVAADALGRLAASIIGDHPQSEWAAREIAERGLDSVDIAESHAVRPD